MNIFSKPLLPQRGRIDFSFLCGTSSLFTSDTAQILSQISTYICLLLIHRFKKLRSWIMVIVSSSPITSWQRDGEKDGKSDRLYFLGLQNHGGLYSHEIKRCLLLGSKAMTNLDSMLKSRDTTLLAKVCMVKALVVPGVMDGCDSWTTKKAEC